MGEILDGGAFRCAELALLVLWVIGCVWNSNAQAGAAAKAPVIMDDFESYGGNDSALKARWRALPHGDPCGIALDKENKAGGQYGLRVDYGSSPGDQSKSFEWPTAAGPHSGRMWIPTPNWDWRGMTAFQFWLKPDGSDRMVMWQFQAADGEMWEVHHYMQAGDTTPRIIRIPLVNLVYNPAHRNNANRGDFKPEAIREFCIMVFGRPGKGTIYVDDLQAVADPAFPAIDAKPPWRDAPAAPKRSEGGKPAVAELPAGRAEAQRRRGDRPTRIRCGSLLPWTDPAGNAWEADQGFFGGGIAYRDGFKIAGTATPEIYRSERHGVEKYAFKLPNGAYTVKLHMAELYWAYDGPGKRIFSVDANGTAVKDIDIYKEAGGQYAALVKTIPVKEIGRASCRERVSLHV
jgi:hypothetical protein